MGSTALSNSLRIGSVSIAAAGGAVTGRHAARSRTMSVKGK
jgi:hypothetical protein